MPQNDDTRKEGLADMLGRAWDRGKEEARKAARKGRDMLQLRQLRADRDTLYRKLGREARMLVEAGEIAHPGLARGLERVREVERRIDEFEELMRGRGEEPEPDPDESEPPAHRGGGDRA